MSLCTYPNCDCEGPGSGGNCGKEEGDLWVRVPLKPTAAMLTALWNRKDVDSPVALADAYRAMLSAGRVRRG